MSQTQQSVTEQFLEVREILKDHTDASSKENSPELIEDYIRTLPEMIPEDSRRDIVRKIIVAAKLDKDIIVGDSERRIDILSRYVKSFSASTDNFVRFRLDEIDELEKRISRLREEIKTRHELQERQIGAINDEMQRLNTVMSFLCDL